MSGGIILVGIEGHVEPVRQGSQGPVESFLHGSERQFFKKVIYDMRVLIVSGLSWFKPSEKPLKIEIQSSTLGSGTNTG